MTLLIDLKTCLPVDVDALIKKSLYLRGRPVVFKKKRLEMFKDLDNTSGRPENMPTYRSLCADSKTRNISKRVVKRF